MTRKTILGAVAFVFGLVLLAGATGLPQQHVTQALYFYDNEPGTDYNTMIAESPSIIIDGYNERIQMGVGGSTDPTTVFQIESSQFNIQLSDGDSLHVGTGDDATLTSDATASTADLAGAWAVSGTGQLTFEDATELRFGTAGADGQCASDGTNIDCTITAAMTLGDGGTTNYISVSSAGVISFNGSATVGAAGANAKVGGALVLNTWQAWSASDTTPDVSGYSYFYTDASTQTLTDFDGSGIAAGQLLIVESTAAVTFDVTSSGLICGDTDVVTADGDLTAWIYNGTDWLCFAFMDLDDNSNTWGAA